jgi:hypothetical protein
MMLSQAGLGTNPDAECLIEMGGHGVRDEDHMVTEVAIRAFYKHYRQVMGL